MAKQYHVHNMAGKDTGRPGKAPGMLLNHDQAMAMYRDVYNSAPWSLYNGNDIVKCCYADSEGNREEALSQYLSIIDNAGQTSQYLLKFHDEGENVTDKSPAVATLRFKMHEYEFQPNNGRVGGMPGGSVVGAVTSALRERREFDTLMEDWAEENGYVRVDDEAEEKDQFTKILTTVGKVGDQYPWLQEHLRDLMTMAKHGFKKLSGIDINNTNTMAEGQKVGKVPGANEEYPTVPQLTQAEINEMLPPLMVLKHEHPDILRDLYLLAKLAQDDKDVFNLAIKKLRQNFE